MSDRQHAFSWMNRIKTVKREYGAIRLCADHALAAIAAAPSILSGTIRRSDIGTASERLEGTYIARVFSEFETAIQQFIRTFHIPNPKTTEARVNRVRDRGRIPQFDADAVHRVREYRNVLVHDRLQPVAIVTIRDATSHLCTFLSRLQRFW